MSPMSTKIGRRHLDRVAVVYVRQSTLAQVREHTESTARQYALAEQAVALGWNRRDVVVIDADLGVSGRSTEGRDHKRNALLRSATAARRGANPSSVSCASTMR